MKKNLFILFLAVLAWTSASKVMADARIDAMSSDPRITDDLDIIWMYPNKIIEYKDNADFRLNSSGGYGNFGQGVGEWGGLTKDLSELGLGGVLAVYLNRPFLPGTGVFPFEYWMPTGGTGLWQNTNVYLYQAPDKPGINGVAASGAATIGGLTPNNKIDLFWADTFFDGFNAGFHLNYGDNQPNTTSNAVTTTADNSISSNNIDTSKVLGAELGIGIAAGFFNKIDCHFGYSQGNYSDTQTYSNSGVTTINNASNDNGIYTYSAGLLLQHDFDNEENNVRIFGDWYSNQFAGADKVQMSTIGNFNDINAVNYLASNQYNLTLTMFGFSGTHKFDDEKSLISSGLLVSYWNSKQTASETDKPVSVTSSTSYGAENDVNITSINWNIGLEAQFTDWFVFRAGIEKFIYDNTQTKYTINDPPAPATIVTTTGDSSDPLDGVMFSTGFGLNMNNWKLDLVASAGSLEQTLQNLQPGNGIFFDNHSGTGTGPIVTIVEAELSHPL